MVSYNFTHLPTAANVVALAVAAKQMDRNFGNICGKVTVAKLVGATALLMSPDGKLLIVKPTYKKGWSLVGGTVHENELPPDAVKRVILQCKL